MKNPISADKAISAMIDYLNGDDKALDILGPYTPGPHGEVIEYRQDAYHDVKVYEDGHEEFFYIGD